MTISHRTIETNGISMHIAEAGSGPLVLLCHGWPESWYSWRHQLKALAEAGYHAVAPDMRGYGGTERPARRDDHTILHLVGDVVDLVRALGAETAVVVGHDWGAAVAWQCALMRPDVFTAVACLSVPFQPRVASGPPTEIMAVLSARAGTGDLYISRFQVDDAHVEMDANPATALRKMVWAYDGATAPADQSTGFIPPTASLLDSISDQATLPPWMSDIHFAEYVAAFEQSGFAGPLDWYRCVDLNWSLTAFLQDRRIGQPSLFITGDRDPVRHYAGRHEKRQNQWLTDLRGHHVLQDAGHWIQQERAEEVSRLLLDFLTDVAEQLTAETPGHLS